MKSSSQSFFIFIFQSLYFFWQSLPSLSSGCYLHVSGFCCVLVSTCWEWNGYVSSLFVFPSGCEHCCPLRSCSPWNGRPEGSKKRTEEWASRRLSCHVTASLGRQQRTSNCFKCAFLITVTNKDAPPWWLAFISHFKISVSHFPFYHFLWL